MLLPMLFLCLFCPYRHSHLASYKPLPSAALPPAVAEAQPIDFLELAFVAQLSCSGYARFSFVVRCCSQVFGSADVLGDVSTGNFRPLLARPSSEVRRRLFPPQHPSPRCQSFHTVRKNGPHFTFYRAEATNAILYGP
jgi:hypothetical protein